jgi:hypothetical protein
MRTVREILRKKGNAIWRVTPETLVYDALRLMAKRRSAPCWSNRKGEALRASPLSATTPGRSSCRGGLPSTPPSGRS